MPQLKQNVDLNDIQLVLLSICDKLDGFPLPSISNSSKAIRILVNGETFTMDILRSNELYKHLEDAKEAVREYKLNNMSIFARQIFNTFLEVQENINNLPGIETSPQ